MQYSLSDSLDAAPMNCFAFWIVGCKMSKDIAGESKRLLDRLNSFRDLEFDWDGYGAGKISEDAIEKAAAFIENMNPVKLFFWRFEIFPTARRGIQLESDRKGYTEIEVFESLFCLYTEEDNFEQLYNPSNLQDMIEDLNRIARK
jgi:hypothetical protein